MLLISVTGVGSVTDEVLISNIKSVTGAPSATNIVFSPLLMSHSVVVLIPGQWLGSVRRCRLCLLLRFVVLH